MVLGDRERALKAQEDAAVPPRMLRVRPAISGTASVGRSSRARRGARRARNAGTRAPRRLVPARRSTETRRRRGLPGRARGVARGGETRARRSRGYLRFRKNARAPGSWTFRFGTGGRPRGSRRGRGVTPRPRQELRSEERLDVLGVGLVAEVPPQGEPAASWRGVVVKSGLVVRLQPRPRRLARRGARAARQTGAAPSPSRGATGRA